MLWILHYVGLCVQISANMEVDNRVSGNALFTEVPHDIISQPGEDVELACSFRGARSSSVSLEIQWWYARHGLDRPEKPGRTTNQVLPEETSSRETKISVVKVVGSNISHKLRLSSVKPSDQGTYECRVIDFSESRTQQHRVQAYLRVQPGDRQEHTQLQNKSPVHHTDQQQHWGDHQLKDGEKQFEGKPDDEDHQRILLKIAAAQRMQEMDHQFRNVDHQLHYKENRTRAEDKHQSESRELQTHATHINSDCLNEDCTL